MIPPTGLLWMNDFFCGEHYFGGRDVGVENVYDTEHFFGEQWMGRSYCPDLA